MPTSCASLDHARIRSSTRSVRARVQYVWKLMRIADKGAGFRTVLKEKVWLGTYHTPINAAVHHDFYKVVLAVEGCIFTCMNIPTCTQPLGKKKTHKLKLNFGLDELPALMYKAVKFSKLWNRHKQDAERYVFRNHSAEAVRSMLEALIAAHCGELRQHIAKNEAVRPPAPRLCACAAARRQLAARASAVLARPRTAPARLLRALCAGSPRTLLVEWSRAMMAACMRVPRMERC